MFLFAILAGLLIFGGAAVVYGIAEDRGHRRTLWALFSLAASSAGCWTAWLWLRHAVETGSTDLGLSGVWLLFSPIVGHVVVVGLMSVTAPPAVSARGRRWRAAWLGLPDRDTDNACTLELVGDDVVAIRPRGPVPGAEVRFRDLLEARADGECLRLRWRDGAVERTALLAPEPRQRARERRVRFAEALARRLDERRRLARI